METDTQQLDLADMQIAVTVNAVNLIMALLARADTYAAPVVDLAARKAADDAAAEALNLHCRTFQGAQAEIARRRGDMPKLEIVQA